MPFLKERDPDVWGQWQPNNADGFEPDKSRDRRMDINKSHT